MSAGTAPSLSPAATLFDRIGGGQPTLAATIFDAATLIIAASIVSARFLFFDVFYPNIDTVTHYRWAAQFAAELAAGEWLPRWTPLGHDGLGEPVFLYYSPLFFYLVAAANYLLGDLWSAIKLVVWAAYCATAISVYWLLRRNSGRALAWLAAVAVIAAPMTFAVRAMINAYPWFAAFPILVIFTALSVRAPERPVRHALLLGLAVALMVLTHILTAFTALVAVGCGLLLSALFGERAQARRRLLGWLAGCALGLGMSAYYLLPAVLALDLVNPAGWHAAGGVNWWDTFAFSFFFGNWNRRLHWLIPSTVYLLFFFAVVVFVRRRAEIRDGGESAALLAAAAIALFLASEASYPVWKSLEPLQLVQRPFRFLPLATIATVLAIARLVPAHRRDGRTLAAAAALCTLFLAPTIVLEAFNGRMLANYRGEHMTIGPQRLHEPHALPEYAVAGIGDRWADYPRAGGLAGECARLAIECRDDSTSAHHRRFAVVGPHAASLPLPLFAFPAWTATVNGRPAQLGRDPATGLVTVAVPAGRAEIRIRWQRLPVERLGMAVSFATLIIALVTLAWCGRRSVRAPLRRQRVESAADERTRGPSRYSPPSTSLHSRLD